MQLNIVIYHGEGCSFCEKAIALADSLDNAVVQLFDVAEQANQLSFRQHFPVAKTIPQILVNGKHVGGFDEFSDMIENMRDGAVGEGQL